LTDLRNAGFGLEISVFLHDRKDTKDISTQENAIRGAGFGSVIGALVALAVPGLGPALVAGPLIAIFNGAAAGGIVGGLIGGTGAFKPLGLPDDVTERLHERVREGGILIAVHSPEPVALEKALSIFKSESAEEIYDSRLRFHRSIQHQPALGTTLS